MAVDVVARAMAAGKVPVTAYEYAVQAGYTGTEEQFAQDMGNSGTNATNAANSATAAAASATTAANAAGNLAPAYSASATYAVGDHVLYDGGYYVCNTAITTAEAWTAAHWTAAKVGPEITDLKTQIPNVKHIIPQAEWDEGSIYASIGTNYNTPSGQTVTRIRTINYFDGINSVGVNDGYKICLYAWKKSDGSYVGVWNGTDFVKTTSNANWTTSSWITSGFKDYKFRLLLAYIDDSEIDTNSFDEAYYVNIVDDTLTLPNIPADAKKVGDEINNIKSSVDLCDLALLNNQIKSDGTIGNDTDYKHTEKIPITAGDVISYNLRVGASYTAVAIYDSNGDFIANKSVRGTGNWGSGTVTVDSDGFVAICIVTTSITNAKRYCVISPKTAGRLQSIIEQNKDEIDSSLDLCSLATNIGKLNLNGEIGNDSTYRYTNRIPIKANDVIIYNLRASTNIAVIAVYDTSGVVIENDVVAGTGNLSSGVFTASVDGYIAICSRDTTIEAENKYAYFRNKTAGQIQNRLNNVNSTLTARIDNLNKTENDYCYITSGKPIYYNRKSNMSLFFPDTESNVIVKGRHNFTVAISDILAAADASSYTTVSNNTTITGERFAIIYDVENSSIKITNFNVTPNLQENEILLFGHYYVSIWAVGLLADYADSQLSMQDMASNVPIYYSEHLANKETAISNNMDSIGQDGETFVFITDIHWEGTNSHISPNLIKDILDKTNVNTLICGGDLINEGVKAAEKAQMLACMKAFYTPVATFPVALGNHDENKNNQSEMPERWFSRDEVFSIIMKPSSNYVKYLSEYDWSFTYDRPGTKTRFLFIDTSTSAIAANAKPAIYNSLKDVPEGYNVIVVSHWLYNTSTSLPTTSATELYAVLDAYNAKTSIEIDNVTYDYSTANGNVKLICIGHSHEDVSGVTTGGIPWILTDSDTYGRSNNSANRSAGTISEHAFDVISVDYSSGNVYAVRIGYGNDRSFSDGTWT